MTRFKQVYIHVDFDSLCRQIFRLEKHNVRSRTFLLPSLSADLKKNPSNTETILNLPNVSFASQAQFSSERNTEQ